MSWKSKVQVQAKSKLRELENAVWTLDFPSLIRWGGGGALALIAVAVLGRALLPWWGWYAFGLAGAFACSHLKKLPPGLGRDTWAPFAIGLTTWLTMALALGPWDPTVVLLLAGLIGLASYLYMRHQREVMTSPGHEPEPEGPPDLSPDDRLRDFMAQAHGQEIPTPAIIAAMAGHMERSTVYMKLKDSPEYESARHGYWRLREGG